MPRFIHQSLFRVIIRVSDASAIVMRRDVRLVPSCVNVRMTEVDSRAEFIGGISLNMQVRLIRRLEYRQDKGKQKRNLRSSLDSATGDIPPQKNVEEGDRRNHKS